MNINIVELITKQLGGDILGKLGPLIGANADQTKSAVGAAVPTLLAGLASAASSGDGAKKLGDAIAGTDSNLLGNFANMLGGNGASNIAQTGTNVLGSLFGNNLLSGVVGALTKFTGLQNSAVGTLLGTLAPMLLGVLGKQQKTMGLDAGGLASMLMGQKNNIASAMPPGLGSLLGGLPGLGGFADLAKNAVSSATGAVGNAASAARGTATHASQAAQSAGSGLMGKLLPIIIIAALAFLAWKWLGSRNAATPSMPALPSAPALPSVSLPKITLPTVDFSGLSGDAGRIAGQIKGTVENTVTSLGSIKDIASAEIALPKLQEAANSIGGMKATWDGLPQIARTTIGTFIQGATPKLQELSSGVIKLPLVGDKVKPVMDDLFAKLATLK